MAKKTKSPKRLRGGMGLSNSNRIDDTSLLAQRQRLLIWLREKPITTIQARGELNILAPAARIFELRHEAGYNITTHWIDDFTFGGCRHRVAKYALMNNKIGGNGHDIK